MPLQRLTLYRMSYFALGFPLLDITQYPHATLAPCGLVGIVILVPHIQQDNSLEPS
jgi:hypothetical protein